jgi:hypothetical protein
VAEEEGELMKAKEEERRRVWEYGEGKKKVFVQVDGINDRATRGWFEAKVGVIFSEAKEVSKDRLEILNKRTYATLEDVSSFGEHFVIEAYKYGVYHLQEVIFGNDGAS